MTSGSGNRRIAWITTDLEALDDPDRDLGPVSAACAERGIEVRPVRWRDSDGVDWSAFDLALLRSPWDYSDHVEAFLAWLAELEGVVPVLNEPATVRSNIDKCYLVDLAAAGLPVVATRLADTADQVRRELRVLHAQGTREIVVKPNISAGSRDTGLFAVDDPGAVRLADHIMATGRRVLLQPAVASVAAHGERGLVVIDGVFSHALVKGPIRTGGGMIGGAYTETVTPTVADRDEIALAEQVVAACPVPTPLFARVDLVATAQGPHLLEAELFEPSLFCDLVDGAADRLAAAVQRRLTHADS